MMLTYLTVLAPYLTARGRVALAALAPARFAALSSRAALG